MLQFLNFKFIQYLNKNKNHIRIFFLKVTTHTPQLAQPVLIERRHPWDFDTYEDIGSYC